MEDQVDLLVIGCGINGAGIARDAAGRGLSVLLCEKGDIAEGTSSRSGKLVHGGLRYLEYYEFRLVREALIEREVLMNSAAHVIWPLRFVLPHNPDFRPAWFVRLGLFVYDHLGGRKKLPGTRVLDLRLDVEGAPLQDRYTKGFEYSDCWADDARLVVLNALDAAERGAKILTRTACTSARREGGCWQAELSDVGTGATRSVRARALINAGGPWVNDVIHRVTGCSTSTRSIRLVKGSHLITHKFWNGPHAYLVQNHDKRVIFINPYEGDRALIGTTDIPYEGTPEQVAVDDGEIDYLLQATNSYFKKHLSRDDVLESFSGVRPLYDDQAQDPSAVTRDYRLDLDVTAGLPLLNIFGGKITTFRKLAEQSLGKLGSYFPNMRGPWTAHAFLPGGDFPSSDFSLFLTNLKRSYPWLPGDLAYHYARLYGTRARDLLGSAKDCGDLGQQWGPLLFEAEVGYLCAKEWAQTPEDILTRRTKHGLHMLDEECSQFSEAFQARDTKPI